jgi:hypothetical protein
MQIDGRHYAYHNVQAEISCDPFFASDPESCFVGDIAVENNIAAVDVGDNILKALMLKG